MADKWDKEKLPENTLCAVKDNQHYHVMNLDDAGKRKYLDNGWATSQYHCHGKLMALTGDPMQALGLGDGSMENNGITFTFTTDPGSYVSHGASISHCDPGSFVDIDFAAVEQKLMSSCSVGGGWGDVEWKYQDSDGTWQGLVDGGCVRGCCSTGVDAMANHTLEEINRQLVGGVLSKESFESMYMGKPVDKRPDMHLEQLDRVVDQIKQNGMIPDRLVLPRGFALNTYKGIPIHLDVDIGDLQHVSAVGGVTTKNSWKELNAARFDDVGAGSTNEPIVAIKPEVVEHPYEKAMKELETAKEEVRPKSRAEIQRRMLDI